MMRAKKEITSAWEMRDQIALARCDHQSIIVKMRVKYCMMVLLLLIAILLCPSFVLSDTHDQQQQQQQTQGTRNATIKSEIMPAQVTHNKIAQLNRTATITTGLSKRTGADISQEPIDLIIFQDKSSESRVRNSGNNKNRTLSTLKQLKRHSYNVTSGSTDHNQTVARSNATSSATRRGDLIVTRLGTDRANQTAPNSSSDPLDTSGSHYSPRHQTNSHYDLTPDESDEYGEGGRSDGDELEASSADDGASIDGASSNLSEKKVVKELTKIISKGMSGATDQVRVETLENLKRRQRERKLLKDNRARVFEEILTSAINNHPDSVRSKKAGTTGGRAKSTSRARAHAGSSSAQSLRHSASSLSGLNSATDLDPELAVDAETVLQHLQGLAAAIDGNSATSSSSSLGSGSYLDAPSSAISSGESESSDDASDASSSAVTSDSSETETSDQRPKKVTTTTSSERPLVRQFKKIKNQISQRRKQLDQIKKLFNIELTIDPKDGRLMGKQLGSSTTNQQAASGKKRGQQHQYQHLDSSEDDSFPPPDAYEGGGGGPSKRTRSPDKARELLSYLRENPEILASVMAELTVDAEPPSLSRSHHVLTRDDTESPSAYHHSLAADYDETPPVSLRRKPRRNGRRNAHHSQLIDPDDIIWAKSAPRSRQSSPQVSLSERTASRFSNKRQEPLDSGALGARRARPAAASSRSHHFVGQMSASSSAFAPATAVKQRTAESLLLESLRERQLLNLARLDLVLAERNKTSPSSSSYFGNVAGGPLSGLARGLSQPSAGGHNDSMVRDDHMETYRRSSYDPEGARNDGRPAQNPNYRHKNGSDEEVMQHHYMMVNPTYAGNDTLGRQLNSNEFMGTFNSNHHLHQQQQRQQQRQAPQTYQPYQRPHPLAPGLDFSAPYSSANLSAGSQQQLTNLATNVNSNSINNYNNFNNQHKTSQQLQSQSALKRFRDWRDVSQSELDRSGGASLGTNNISLFPYDLSTGGGTLASTMEAQSSKSPLFMNYNTGHQRAPPSGPADNSGNSSANQQGAISGAARQVMVDGSGNGAAMAQQNFDLLAAPRADSVHSSQHHQQSSSSNMNSLFMTRSSAAEPDLTFVKLKAYDDQAAPKNANDNKEQTRLQQQQQVRSHSDQVEQRGQRTKQEDEDLRRADEVDESVDTDQLESADKSDDLGSNISGASGGTKSHTTDYFSSYKDEIATRRGSRAKLNNKQAQQRDVDSDDTGAMWA